MRAKLSRLAIASLLAINPLYTPMLFARPFVNQSQIQANATKEGYWGLSQTKTLADIKLESSGGFVVTDPRVHAALGYDPSRQWRSGQSAADVLKVGETDELFKIKDLTPRQLAELSGTNVNSIPLLSLYDQATIGDLIKINPDIGNAPALSIPAVRDLIQGRYSSAIQTGVLISEDYSDEIKEFLDARPELRDLPIKDILNGDFKAGLPTAQLLALRELRAKLPEQFKELPIKSLPALTDLSKGNIGGAVEKGLSISVDHFDQLERFYEKHPALKNVPIADVINGKWDRVATTAEKFAFKKLAKTIPESSQKFAGKALPVIKAARDGDFSQLYQISGNSIQGFNTFLENNPHLKNLPLNQLLRGDVQAALPKAQQFAIYEIAKKLPDQYKGLPAQGLDALYDLKDGRWENSIETGVEISGEYFKEVQQFFKAHPELADVSISEVLKGDFDSAIDAGEEAALKRLEKVNKYLADLPLGAIAKGNYDQALKGGIKIGAKYALDKLLAENPALQDVALGVLDNPRYSIGSVEGLADTSIGAIKAIDSKALSKIPGLNKIPLDFINANNISALLKGDLFGRIDIPLGDKELIARNAISGFTRGKKFTPTPCDAEADSKSKHCAHVELRDYAGLFGSSGNSLLGKQFTSKAHKGKGGWSFLKGINGGYEPAGVSPWGVSAKTNNLKLIIKKVSEVDGSRIQTPSGYRVYTESGYAEFGLTFGICIRALFVNTCSPSFIELPTEFIPKELINFKVAEGGRVLIASTSPAPKIPKSLRKRYRQQYGAGNQYCAVPSSGSGGGDTVKYGHKQFSEADRDDLVLYNVRPDGLPNYVQPEVVDPLNDIVAEAREQGLTINVGDTHRTIQEQEELFQSRGGDESAAKSTAPGGHSEHHTGYAVDFTDSSGRLIQEGSPEHQFLQQRAEKYGFEQSFDGSGPVVAEAWHYRYNKSDKAKQALRLDGETAISTDQKQPGDPAIASVRPPQTETEEFVAKTVALSKKYGIDPVDTLTIMSFETGGTLDPAITNGIGATGLIQFIPTTAQGLGTSTAQLRQMSRVQQLDFVDKYFSDVGIQAGDDLATIYASVLTGSRVGNRNSSDGSHTVNTAVQKMGEHRQRAIALLQGAENLDTSGYQFNAGIPGPCIASNASGPIVQGDGIGTGQLADPLPGSLLTSPYGWRTRPGTNQTKFHKGIDLSTGVRGTPILAADGGTVVYVNRTCVEGNVDCGGQFGNRVEIDHGNGIITAYNHLENVDVVEGQSVSKGQAIGGEGSTGWSTGPHLDFQVFRGNINNHVNPLSFLK